MFQITQRGIRQWIGITALILGIISFYILRFTEPMSRGHYLSQNNATETMFLAVLSIWFVLSALVKFFMAINKNERFFNISALFVLGFVLVSGVLSGLIGPVDDGMKFSVPQAISGFFIFIIWPIIDLFDSMRSIKLSDMNM